MSAEDDAYTLAGASQYPETSVQIHCIALSASAQSNWASASRKRCAICSIHQFGFAAGQSLIPERAVDFTDFSDDSVNLSPRDVAFASAGAEIPARE
jgi:hypothetical protein